MFADIVGFLEHWIPELIRTNRSYLTIAIGCTGGQHRSVYLVERLAQHFSAQVSAGPRAPSGRRRRTAVDRTVLAPTRQSRRAHSRSDFTLSLPLHCAPLD